MLKTLNKIVLAAMLLSLSGHSLAQDSEADRKAAVDRYFQVIPFDSMIREMSEEMAKQLPEDQRTEFVKFMTSEVRFDVVLATAKKSLATHLTTEEIDAFTTFMSSPVGKSAMGKMKYYMADVMPVIQTEVARAIKSREHAPAKG